MTEVRLSGSFYKTVAASQTDTVLEINSGKGQAGDYFESLLIVPATLSPGAVSIKDGSGSAITVFTGGASSVADLKPFPVRLGAKSSAGAWKVTTGAAVSVVAMGEWR